MRLLGGILIVAGTTIGAGTLALPLVTGAAGFIPSVILFCIVWAFMTYSAYLILEVNLSMESGVNLVTMARRTLGPVGELIAWSSYLLLLYTLTAAYLSKSGELLSGFLPAWVAPLPLVALLGGFIVAGIRNVDLLNRFLMAGMAVTFVMLLYMVLPKVEPERLLESHPSYLVVALPVVITAFGFHIVIPSLTAYFNGNLRQCRRCILVGSLIPLAVYLLWQLALLGSRESVSGWVAGIFSFLIIVTSLLGVMLSLWDFLADGLRLHHTRRGRLLLSVLTFVPPLLYAWLYPEGFVVALGYAGIFVAVLLGLLPIAMAWSERYIQRRTLPFRTWGGRGMLTIAGLFFVICIISEVLKP
jgi:tyrosine-specific transport protein